MAPKTSKSLLHSVRSDHQTSEIWTRSLVRPSIWAPMQMSARISDRRNRKLSGFRSANDRTSRSRINANKRPSQPPFEHVSNAPTKVVAEEEGGGEAKEGAQKRAFRKLWVTDSAWAGLFSRALWGCRRMKLVNAGDL